MTYKDILARRSIAPITIYRTRKRPGDLVLTSWARPAIVHQGGAGANNLRSSVK